MLARAAIYEVSASAAVVALARILNLKGLFVCSAVRQDKNGSLMNGKSFRWSRPVIFL